LYPTNQSDNLDGSGRSNHILLIEKIRVRKHVLKERPTVTGQRNWLFTMRAALCCLSQCFILLQFCGFVRTHCLL